MGGVKGAVGCPGVPGGKSRKEHTRGDDAESHQQSKVGTPSVLLPCVQGRAGALEDMFTVMLCRPPRECRDAPWWGEITVTPDGRRARGRRD